MVINMRTIITIIIIIIIIIILKNENVGNGND